MNIAQAASAIADIPSDLPPIQLDSLYPAEIICGFEHILNFNHFIFIKILVLVEGFAKVLNSLIVSKYKYRAVFSKTTKIFKPL